MAPRPYKRSCGGSSPLTRGKWQIGLAHQLLQRLIPAHAGKIPTRARTATWSWAHPRSRGENKVEGLVGVADLGSSPLTRGKWWLRGRDPSRPRLIPAHAGKISTYSHTRAHPRAHPRSRGENPLTAASSAAADGSSPLTRGKSRRAVPHRQPDGLIPAHAGKIVIEAMSCSMVGAHPRSRGENA